MCFIFLCLLFLVLVILTLVHIVLCSFLKVVFDILILGVVVTILMNIKGGENDNT